MIRAQMAGTQRSGSNLLRLILGAHDTVFAPPSVHVLRVFRDLVPGYEPLERRANRVQLIDDVRTLIELNVFAWPAGAPPRREIERRWDDDTIAGLCRATYDAGAAQQGATAWVCKSLENAHHLPELLRAMPDLVVLHLVRDGRDVGLSFRRLPVGPKHPYVAAREWTADQRAVTAMAPGIAPSRLVRVRYEDVLRDPAGAVGTVGEALGFDFDERSLAFHLSDEAQGAPGRSPLWENLDRPILPDNTHRFADPAERDYVELFEAAAFETLVDLGYPPIYATRPGAFSAVEVDGFEAHDRELRARARAAADEAIEALHRPQEEFVGRLRRLRGRPSADG